MKSEEEALKIVSRLEKGTFFSVTEVVRKERKKFPAVPFTTSSLQQEAARKLNMKAKKTMLLAQQLYEGDEIGRGKIEGLITYMRTDSTRISAVAQEESQAYIMETFGQAYVGLEKKKQKNNDNSQDAHEAIRPTSTLRTPEELKDVLSRDQYRLYKLIWERFLASQMAPAKLDTVRAKISKNGLDFYANGSTVKFQGFMKVYVESTDDKQEIDINKRLPALEEGDEVVLCDISPKQHFTQPPPRYTEARLVKTLEELGIGRPSTYVATIETIQKRGYVILDNKRFIPTELGAIVVDIMNQYFMDIMNVEFTAQMESSLDLIGEGKKNWVQVVNKFYDGFHKELLKAEEELAFVELTPDYVGEQCEHCGAEMVYKHGRYGKFMACSNFPDCRNAKPIIKDMGVVCPKCQKGNIIERKSNKRGKTFYGCSTYPDCDFTSWDKPITRPCPKCNSVLVEKKLKKSLKISCLNCDYEEQQA